MACPVCAHTMQNIGTDTAQQFWCPRCGTIKDESGVMVGVPKLVERCRQLKDQPFPHGPLILRGELHAIMNQLGILESIGRPGR